MFNTGIVNAISRLVKNNVFTVSRNISTNTPLYWNTTNVLCAEPLKKKKRLDPAIVRAKEERRKRKLEKFIRRLEKHARQLKPIADIDIPMKLKDELPFRERKLPVLSVEELENRARIFKDWTKYKTEQHKETINLINKYITYQDLALKELREISEDLYKSSIEIDHAILPFSAKGPALTPPIENFDAPDGDYVDITKKYEGE